MVVVEVVDVDMEIKTMVVEGEMAVEDIKLQRTIVNCYFQTHGSGGHWSWEYNTPQKGHQWYATFQNKIGGSQLIAHVFLDYQGVMLV